MITHMIKYKIDILCLQETKMPGSNVERQHTHSLISHRIYKEISNTMESDFASTTEWKNTEAITYNIPAT